MTNIIKRIVSTGSGQVLVPPNPVYFAVHSTANPGASAANHVNYWTNNPRKAVHLVSDWKEAYQCVDFKYKCNQVGNGNGTCIGLEICEATNKADFERGLAIARDVILQVLNQRGWTVDKNVRSHKWFTENYGGSDHIDPIPYLNKWGWSWDKFINYLKEGDDIVTEDQMNQIADKVWLKMINGVRACDRLQGTDEAANNARHYAEVAANVLTDTSDPTGRSEGVSIHDQVRWMAKKQQEMYEKLDKIYEKLDV